MGLPWIRLDTNIASHEKILSLVETDKDPRRWQAAFSYVCGIGWSAGSGTDGRIPAAALRYMHGDKRTAELLVKHGLWDEAPGGFMIHNYGLRQELRVVKDAKEEMRQISAEKAACTRWHGSTCWTDKGCSRSL